MWRYKKQRNILSDPSCYYFSPVWIEEQKLQTIELNMDEFEAIKISDVDWFSMQLWSKMMKISSSTFCRILKNARKKVWDAIVFWCAIKICTCNQKDTQQ